MSWDSKTTEDRVRDLENELRQLREGVNFVNLENITPTNVGISGRGAGANTGAIGPVSYPFAFNPVPHRRWDTEPPPQGGSNVFDSIFVRTTGIILTPKEIEIGSISGVGVVTVVTLLNHQLSTSDVVDIIDTVNFNVNGVTITVTSPTTFTYLGVGNLTAEAIGNVRETITPVEIRTIADASFNGQIILISMDTGLSGTLLVPTTTEGNINITSNINFDETQVIYLQWREEATTGMPLTGGSWVVVGSTGSGGGGNVPVGTAENQHLEWNNAGLVWEPKDFLEFNSSVNPHATSGGLRFINDDIWVAGRTGANDGNIELKFTTQDELDLTNSNESTVKLLLRSQHAVDADNLFLILQGSGSGASGGILAQNNITFTSNLATTNMLLTSTDIQVTTPIEPSADGTLSIGSVSNRFLSMHAAQFGIDVNNRMLLAVGLGFTFDASQSYTFDVAASQRFQITSGLVQIIGDGEVTADLSVGAAIDLTESATPTPASNRGYLYTKDVSATTHLFYIGDGFAEIDMTPGVGGFATKALDNLLNPNLNAALAWDTNGFYDLGEQLFTIDNIWTRSMTFNNALSSSPINAFGGIGEDASGVWINIGFSTESFRVTAQGTDLMTLDSAGGGATMVLDTPAELWFGLATTRGEIKHSGGNFILNRGNSGLNDGIDLQTFGNSRLFVSEGGINASTDLKMQSNDILTVVNIRSNGGGGATTGVIGDIITNDGGFNYYVRDTIAWESDPDQKIEFLSAGINIETNGSSDDITLNALGLTSDIVLTATQIATMYGQFAGVTGTISAILQHSTGAQLTASSTKFNFALGYLDINTNYIQFDGVTAASVTQTAGQPKLFANSSNSDHLSVRSGDGSLIDLEVGGGGTGATRELDNLLVTAINAQLNLNNGVSILPLTDITGSSLGDSTHSFSRLYVERVAFNTTTRYIGVSGADDMIFEIPSTGSMFFRENGTTFWELDGLNNICKFNRDIELTSGEAVRANAAAEIGFFTTNYSGSVGSEGSVQLPSGTQSSASAASADAKYGAAFGCCGVYDSGLALTLYIRQNNGDWSALSTIGNVYGALT